MSTGLVAAQQALILGQLSMRLADGTKLRVYPAIPPPKDQPKPPCWVNSLDWTLTENRGNTTLTESDATAMLLFDVKTKIEGQQAIYELLDSMIDMTSRLPIGVKGLSRVLPRGGVPTMTTLRVNGKNYLAAELVFRMTFTQTVNLLTMRAHGPIPLETFTIGRQRAVIGKDGWCFEHD